MPVPGALPPRRAADPARRRRARLGLRTRALRYYLRPKRLSRHGLLSRTRAGDLRVVPEADRARLRFVRGPEDRRELCRFRPDDSTRSSAWESSSTFARRAATSARASPRSGVSWRPRASSSAITFPTGTATSRRRAAGCMGAGPAEARRRFTGIGSRPAPSGASVKSPDCRFRETDAMASFRETRSTVCRGDGAIRPRCPDSSTSSTRLSNGSSRPRGSEPLLRRAAGRAAAVRRGELVEDLRVPVDVDSAREPEAPAIARREEVRRPAWRRVTRSRRTVPSRIPTRWRGMSPVELHHHGPRRPDHRSRRARTGLRGRRSRALRGRGVRQRGSRRRPARTDKSPISRTPDRS